MSDDPDDDDHEPDSGPFCRHWCDPSDCDEVCAGRMHPCCRHDQDDEGSCYVDGCACERWQEPETP